MYSGMSQVCFFDHTFYTGVLYRVYQIWLVVSGPSHMGVPWVVGDTLVSISMSNSNVYSSIYRLDKLNHKWLIFSKTLILFNIFDVAV